MIRIEVTSADLAASRFAVSPLLETMHALWTLSGRAEAGPHRAWVARWRGAYARLARRHPGLDAIAAISGNRGSANVDFIAPPPTGVRAAFADELARMRGTPLSLAHAEIERVLARLPRPPSPGVLEILRGPDVVRVIAEAFEAAWTEIVAAEWPRFRAVLERDVVQRAGRLAAYGWGEALDDLGEQVRWRAGHIELAIGPADEMRRHELGGRGLLFLPTVFNRRVAAFLDDAWPYALIYPARGVGVPRPAPRGLATLIGRTRARVLAELAEPATTTQLAAVLGVSLGTAGEHVAALRAAGAVAGTRTGRSVLYHRTELGDLLARAGEGPSLSP